MRSADSHIAVGIIYKVADYVAILSHDGSMFDPPSGFESLNSRAFIFRVSTKSIKGYYIPLSDKYMIFLKDIDNWLPFFVYLL